jgi:hypothetical protein
MNLLVVLGWESFIDMEVVSHGQTNRQSCNKGVGHDFCINKLGGKLSLVYILQYLVSRNI